VNTFDLVVLLWFNGLAGRFPLADRAIVLLTSYAPVFFFLLFALFYLGRSPQRDQTRRAILLAGLSGVFALLLAVGLAHLIYRPRPFVVLPRRLHLLIPHAPDSSFPSDHATGSAGFAAGFWPAPHAYQRWLILLLALLVGVSRLVAGVHWPSDILGSFRLGTAAAWSLRAVARPLAPFLDRLVSASRLLDRPRRR
jgi:undecaprenyl-diphosphatase